MMMVSRLLGSLPNYRRQGRGNRGNESYKVSRTRTLETCPTRRSWLIGKCVATLQSEGIGTLNSGILTTWRTKDLEDNGGDV